LLKRIDCGALIAWAVAEDLHRQAATAQAKVGLLVRIKTKATADKDDPGVPAASPYINIINQQAKIMLKAASELGFTPVSRPRIGAGAPLLPAAPEWIGGDGGQKPRRSLQDFLDSNPTRQVKH
jgi:phage terminase small subunit